ncbi:transposase [Burkholderia latens]|uniref:transposase n=1 Tax=Burkholderia latens TaxID=488446 RepID=UPI003C7A24B5
MVAADAGTAITFALSPGRTGDAPQGRALLESLEPPNRPLHLLMEKAYEGNETRQLALDLGFIPVLPPLRTRVEPLGVPPRNVQASQRSRATVPPVEGLPSHLLALLQARCDVHCLYQLRLDH